MTAAKGDATFRFSQLPLGVRLRDTSTFANYFAGVNREVVNLLQASLTTVQGFVYLWGSEGSGKTHLLQAVCHAVGGHQQALAYLPLRELRDLSVEVLEGIEHLPLVLVDDVDAIAGRAEWETGLFHLYNRLAEQGAMLIVAGARSPAASEIALPDLRSRLAACLVLQLRGLDDREKAEALRLQARQRGMEMPEEVAGYLLRHCSRDMRALFRLLDSLDQASLAAQRKLTVPFVKAVLHAG